MTAGRPGRRWSHLLVIVVVVLGAAATVRAAPAPRHHVHHGRDGETDVTVCADAAAGLAQCLAHERTDDVARSNRPARPGSRVAGVATSIGNNGAYDPAFLRSAYNTPSATAGSGQTVAIVDAYDDPNAYADMTVHRS